MRPAHAHGSAEETWKEFDHNVITHSAAHHLMAIDDLVQRLDFAPAAQARGADRAG